MSIYIERINNAHTILHLRSSFSNIAQRIGYSYFHSRLRFSERITIHCFYPPDEAMGKILHARNKYSTIKQSRTQFPSPNKRIERLRHNTLFENIDDNEFENLRGFLTEHRFFPGEVIRGADEECSRLFLIAVGRIKIVRTNSGGDEILLALLHERDFFGELELIDGRYANSRVVAMEQCIIFELPKKVFDELITTNHPFAHRLLQVLSVRLRALSQHHLQEMEHASDSAQRELDKLHQLIKAAAIVNSTLNVDELLKLIVDTALEIVDADAGTLYLINRSKNELWSKVLKGSTFVEIHMPIGKGIAGYVAATGETVNIPNAYLDSRFNPEIDAQTGYRTKTILCTPIRNKNRDIIGVLQLINQQDDQFTEDDENFIDALSIHSALALENARLYELERQKLAMEKELHAARNVQMSLLPQFPPKINGYDIAGKTVSAQLIGGDYFDFIPVDEHRIVICLGDVTGKGLPAALLMANLQAILRSAMMLKASPKRCMRRTNTLLFQSTASDKFVTLFYGVLDHRNHLFTFSNAGHEWPYVLRKGEPHRALSSGGLVLGIMENVPYDEETIALQPGDTIFIYSDGVNEAWNPWNEQFGQEKLHAFLEEHQQLTASELIDMLIEEIHRHESGTPQMDDITITVIKRLTQL